MNKERWKVGQGYEQSDPGIYIYSEKSGIIICASQDSTDCPLTLEDAKHIVELHNNFIEELT